MKKRFEEILTDLLTSKKNTPELDVLTSTSKTSIWGKILEIVAWAIYNFQLAVQLHMTEIEDMIKEQKVFNLLKYRTEALRFQYGFDLLPDSDVFKDTFLDQGVEVKATPEQVESSKIVKYAASSRIVEDGKVRILLKIAPENLDDVFDADHMAAFTHFIEEIQPAGDHVSIVNYRPDILKFGFRIKYDPKILNANGMNILTAEYTVRKSIESFLKYDLPFNGELSVQALEDAIRKTEGVLDLQTEYVETKYIDPSVGDYGTLQPVNMSVVPESGRFKVAEEYWQGLNFVL